VQFLLEESREWVDPKQLDDMINQALDNPIDIYAPVEKWEEEEEEEEEEEDEPDLPATMP
jgi:hypothetical protein